MEIAVGPRTFSEQFQVLAMQVFFCAAHLSSGMACLLNYRRIVLNYFMCVSKQINPNHTHSQRRGGNEARSSDPGGT